METKEMVISDKLIQIIRDDVSKNKSEIDWGHDSKLSNEQICLIMKGKVNEVIEQIWDGYDSYDDEVYIIKNSLEEFIKELKSETGESDIEVLYDELRDYFIDYVNIGSGISRLISNTGDINIRVQMYSNYDCISSHHWESSGGYSYHNDYFTAVIDQLNLNPKRVQRLLHKHGIKTRGTFPNHRRRNGKEYISYEDFWQELENNTSGSLLTFIGRISLDEFVSDKEDGITINKVTIPKGNAVGFYSDFQGGGSCFESKLKRNKIIYLTKPYSKTEYDTYKFIYDEDPDYGYNMKHDVFGVVDEFFGKRLKIEVKKDIN